MNKLDLEEKEILNMYEANKLISEKENIEDYVIVAQKTIEKMPR